MLYGGRLLISSTVRMSWDGFLELFLGIKCLKSMGSNCQQGRWA